MAKTAAQAPKARANNKSSKRILITSALPYVNNVPHLGNIIGCVLSADVFARFCRARGYETLYVCGADEHGTATETKALEEGLTPKQICDKYYKIHKDIYEWFNCSFDIFGRTSTKEHVAIVQNIFKQLYKNGYIAEGTLEQAFCVKCNTFRADRYVQGTCPHCGYEQARGDQCDKCAKLLNPAELKDPHCKICGSRTIIKESEHLFLDLPKLGPKLKTWFDKQSKSGFWPQNAIATTNAWFHEGLKQRCITRDLAWGVSVPLKGYENKVFYVWFDAPIGYVSITASLTKKWESWWKQPAAAGVRLYQFMAKDNIPFHSILFPATQIGTGDAWTMVHHLSSVEYLNYESGKFSKSNKQGVFGDDAMNSNIQSDVWRYYLLHNRPEASDSEFSWQDFQEKNNNELLANLGNFVNRTLVFIRKYFDGKVPHSALGMGDERFVAEVNVVVLEITKQLEGVKLREPLKMIMQISKMGNAYFQNHEPWKLVKEDAERCKAVLFVCANLVKLLPVLVEPYLPETAKEMRKQLNVKGTESSLTQWPKAFDLDLAEGHKIGLAKPLFRKIEDAEIQRFKEQFKGLNDKNARGVDVQDPFAQLDLRVAKIADIREHPNAEKLYVLDLDLGKEKRQLVAGLRPYYPKEELKGKHIVIIANLKPAVLRGVESQGMLLAGQEGNVVKVLETKAAPGTQVNVDGIVQKPAKQLEIDQFLAVGLKVADGVPGYKGKKLRAGKDVVAIQGVKDGIIR